MRARTSQWFECKIKYEKVTEEGVKKPVTERYVVNALSFAEAEERITEEMLKYISGDFEVVDVKKANYTEIFFMTDAEKVLSNEEEKMAHAMNKGREAAMEQYGKPTDWNPGNADARWYKAKLQFITVDERTGNEKRSNVTYLVQACSLHNALDNIDATMRGTMIDYVQANVGETQIIDVLEVGV